MAAEKLAIFSLQKSPRLQYVLDWIFSERMGIAWNWAENPLNADIVYGIIQEGKISIPDGGLIFESGLSPIIPSWGDWKGLPVIFASSSADNSIPFDLFAAVFYCLSRYEEYLPDAQRDVHGRFDHRASLFHHRGLLTRPLVDEWIQAWAQDLKFRGYPVHPSRFRFLPSFDIDQAYAFLHQGFIRSLGKSLRRVLRQPTQIRPILSAWRGKTIDPYDQFGPLDRIEEETGIRGIYFFLLAPRQSAFDRNLPPGLPAMQALIQKQSQTHILGLHPSYYSLDQPGKLKEEKHILERAIGKPVHRSRQHYIRWTHPGDMRKLIELGIREDYSMGYGGHIGFRAATSWDFPWYDLERESTTALRVFPFCFMDTTARYFHGWDSEQAFEALNQMAEKLRQSGGMLITIFHNSSLGPDPGWEGWGSSYADFHRRWALFSDIDPGTHPHQGK